MTPKEELAELLRERTAALAALDAVVARYEALVAEPKPELTQRELDREAYDKWQPEDPDWGRLSVCSWHAALAWERGKVRALLEQCSKSSDTILMARAVYDKLAKRVGLTP